MESRTITFHQPRKLVVGSGCVADLRSDLQQAGAKRVFVVTTKSVAALAAPLKYDGCELVVHDAINAEPTVTTFRTALAHARDVKPDAVIGFGGGSPLDVAKLVAALLDSTQDIADVFGIDKLNGRKTYLACVPTTAGTGSEVSPNAIILDEAAQLKKGVISRFLMPDGAYIDPSLTVGMPPAVTASTGLDALTHCIEAYANKFAHPMADVYALEGIRRVAKSLAKAVADGTDLAARTDVAYGSLYGGLCLGPVNTGAVHALAYPLGSEFGVAHGISNALLLPYVLEFNLPAALDRYADIAIALGVPPADNAAATAHAGLDRLKELSKQCNAPTRLRDVGVPQDAIPRLAKGAMTVTRLLERNVRVVTENDAIHIYNKAW